MSVENERWIAMAILLSSLKQLRRARLIAGAAVFCGSLGLVPALGQSQADFIYLQDRLGRLESQMQALQGSGGASGVTNVGTASIAVRLDAIEERLRNLTGLAEQNAFRLQQLEDMQRRLSEDVEFRFQELGAGGGNRSSLQPQPIAPAPTGQSGFSQQSLPPPSSSASIGSNSIGQPQGTLGTLQLGPVNINPIVQSGNFPPPSSGGQVALGVPIDARGEYDVAYAYILQRDYDGAELAFTQFLQNHPGSEYSANAKYWLGETFFVRGQYRSAADAFLRSYTEHKNGRKAADSLLKLGMSLQQLGQTSAACSSFSELISNYPNSGDVRARAIQEQQNAGC